MFYCFRELGLQLVQKFTAGVYGGIGWSWTADKNDAGGESIGIEAN